ncbi:MAG: hypothetical protein KBG30_01580 [Bacteroidales bacterium]|jgi:hypothetical protein|nr:hypothetical protein [Bacteroidales bacterium]
MKTSTILWIAGGLLAVGGIITGVVIYKRKNASSNADYSKFFAAVQSWINYMKANNWGNKGNPEKQIGDAVYQLNQEFAKGTKTKESLNVQGLDYASMIALAKTGTYNHF